MACCCGFSPDLPVVSIVDHKQIRSYISTVWTFLIVLGSVKGLEALASFNTESNAIGKTYLGRQLIESPKRWKLGRTRTGSGSVMKHYNL